MAPSTTIFKSPGDWLSIKDANGFYYSERRGVDSISVLPFRIVGDDLEVMLHKEPNVAHNHHRHYNIGTIGGALNPSENPLSAALRELSEEGGYKNIRNEDVIELGIMFCTTQSSEHVYLYAVDVTNYEQYETELEPGEIGENIWVPYDTKYLYDIEDPRYLATVVRMLYDKGTRITQKVVQKIQDLSKA